MPRFISYNAAAPTTAAMVKVTTSTSIKTMLQIATPSNRPIRVVEWGISFDASAAATPGTVELLHTDVAATVTAHVAAGVQALDGNSTSLMTLGTSATGYTATAEGSITASRSLDTQLISPTAQYVKQFLPDAPPIVPASRFLRWQKTRSASSPGRRPFRRRAGPSPTGAR